MRRLLALVVVLCAFRAWAEPDKTQPKGSYDAPERVQPHDTADDRPSVACTWYADLMVRETDVEGPHWGASYIVHRQPGAPPPPCDAPRAASDVRVFDANMIYEGRRGDYLYYDSAEGPVIIPFAIVRARDGKQLYTDTIAELTSMSTVGGVLRLTYDRAYGLGCSLPKDGAVCWAKAMKAGRLARAVASQPPPIAACAERYRLHGDKPGDESTLIYAVDMTLTAEGHATVLSRGALRCEPTG